jgi:hypothetical protein
VRVGPALSLPASSRIPPRLAEKFQPPHALDYVALGGNRSSDTLSLVVDKQLRDPHISDDTVHKRALDPSELLRIE